ncbi:transcription elongation factor A protein 3-like isoform X2 [Pseudophryne corroboree]|uniref:transcription elongation factor A protein 3-like isoform X2 n=1 Tax=Pseudophryne corroboree TaxID=495146 RepID=UPI0030813F22
MGSEEELLRIGRKLEKRINERNLDCILDLLKELQRFQITVSLLRSTRIGVTVNKLRKQCKDREIGEIAKVIIRDWKRLLESSYKTNDDTVESAMSSPTKAEPARSPSAAHKNLHTEKGSDSPEIHSTSQDQPHTAKESKIKRSQSTDFQSLSHSSKKPERRLSLNASLPSSSASCKSSSNTKEDRKNSIGSPNVGAHNGSSKSSTNTIEERPSGVLASSPTCSSPPSCALLAPCYATGDSVRDKCVEMVAAALKTDDDYKQFGTNCKRIGWEIEECIYNEIKATDMKYRNRVRSRISNLKDPKNPNLRRNVLCGVVSPQKMATMTAEEMASDELKELRNTLTQEAIREHQMAKTGGTQTDLLQCDKCRKKNCSYNQVQTRSADEPMTTFVLCNECGHRWKFC